MYFMKKMQQTIFKEMNTQSIFPFQNRDQYDSKSDIKSQNSQMIMETNDVNFSQYAYICMTFRVEI